MYVLLKYQSQRFRLENRFLLHYTHVASVLFTVNSDFTMPYDIPKTVSKIYIHTGNVLNANELTQKAGQNATEEVTIFTFVFRYLNGYYRYI